MKKSIRRTAKRLAASALAVCMTAGLTGCGAGSETPDQLSQGVKNLMEGIEVQAAEKTTPEAEELTGVVDFSVELLQKCMAVDDGRNTILSPTSVLFALAMTANGAKGDTLAQMEDVLGMSLEELNTTMPGALREKSGEKYKLSLANSIWFTEENSFQANQEFLEKNAESYGAEIYQTVFDDAAKDAINEWVDEHTGGMIKNILDKIPEDAVMYLVNAVAFDAEWRNIYKENNIYQGEFTNERGEKTTVDFMHSEEGYYLEDEHATGMLKHYAGGEYAFAALLPKEGMSVEEYVQTLSGAGIQKMLDEAQTISVGVKLPKFTCEADYSMAEILSELGMPDAFGAKADFTGIGSVPAGEHLLISRVLHKAKIEVDERGTKAGAATIVEVLAESAMEPQEYKEVFLDRPFVYMIVDCETNLPIFMGTVMNLK